MRRFCLLQLSPRQTAHRRAPSLRTDAPAQRCRRPRRPPRWRPATGSSSGSQAAGVKAGSARTASSSGAGAPPGDRVPRAPHSVARGRLRPDGRRRNDADRGTPGGRTARRGRFPSRPGPPDLLVVGVERLGASAWATNRTSGLSMPRPKAVVATTTTRSSPLINASWAARANRRRRGPSVVRGGSDTLLGVSASASSSVARRVAAYTMPDPGLAATSSTTAARTAALVHESADLEQQIRPVEARERHERVTHPQPLDDVLRTGAAAVAVDREDGRMARGLDRPPRGANSRGGSHGPRRAHAMSLVHHDEARSGVGFVPAPPGVVV